MQGTERELTLASALCLYTLAFEGVVSEVKVALVKGGRDEKFILENRILLNVSVVDEAPDEIRDVELPAVHIQVRILFPRVERFN